MPRGINWSGQANTIPLHIISKSVYRPSCTLLGASKRVPVPFAPQAAVPFLSACPCPQGIHVVRFTDDESAVGWRRHRPVNSQSTAALPGRRTEQHEAPLGLVPSAARDPGLEGGLRSERARARGTLWGNPHKCICSWENTSGARGGRTHRGNFPEKK